MNNNEIYKIKNGQDVYEFTKKRGNIMIVPNEGIIFYKDLELTDRYSIAKAIYTLNTYEWMKDNYRNSQDELWEIAEEVYDYKGEAEANGGYVSEQEAIDDIAEMKNIELIEEVYEK